MRPPGQGRPGRTLSRPQPLLLIKYHRAKRNCLLRRSLYAYSAFVRLDVFSLRLCKNPWHTGTSCYQRLPGPIFLGTFTRKTSDYFDWAINEASIPSDLAIQRIVSPRQGPAMNGKRGLRGYSNRKGNRPFTQQSVAADEFAAAAWSKGVRNEALGNLAHELRTPVQVLMGYIDILREEAPPN